MYIPSPQMIDEVMKKVPKRKIITIDKMMKKVPKRKIITIDKMMKKIPKRKIITIDKIKEHLAKKNNAEITGPLTTGIFTWISAYAADEERQETKKAGKPIQITPYWRTLKTGGVINKKYLGVLAAQKKLLESEEYKILAKGKNFIVKNFEKKLTKLKV